MEAMSGDRDEIAPTTSTANSAADGSLKKNAQIILLFFFSLLFCASKVFRLRFYNLLKFIFNWFIHGQRGQEQHQIDTLGVSAAFRSTRRQ
jgi:hypothetical protein